MMGTGTGDIRGDVRRLPVGYVDGGGGQRPMGGGVQAGDIEGWLREATQEN